jgi:FkbM family methyltransferase
LEAEVGYLPTLINRRGVTIDVGAFNGDYSYALAKLSKSVMCFEPQPALAEMISRYKNDKIKVFNIGLSDTQGSLELHIPVIDGVLNRPLASFRNIEGPCQTMTIPVNRMDDFNFTDVTFIKIDVEGYESKVVAGAKETILRETPVLLIEIEQRHLNDMGLSVDDVFKQVLDMNYRGFYLKNGALKDLNTFSYANDQEPFLDCVHSKNYINNFIFKPAGKDSSG